MTRKIAVLGDTCLSNHQSSWTSSTCHSFGRAARLIGDHWMLLIVRQLSLNTSLTFTELLLAVRGISTNILSDRLRQLVSEQLLTADQSGADGRKRLYSLTSIGTDLQPVIHLIELWGRKYLATEKAERIRR